MNAAPTLILATRNPHKVQELQALLGEGAWPLHSLDAYPHVQLPPETGFTFEANAMIKAEAVARAIGSWALADDSGLMVDALGGAPGVYSARYAGEPSNDRRNIARVLADLCNVSLAQRSARYVAVLALAHPDHATRWVHGECAGLIATAPRGQGGFGYDPIFYLPDRGQTMAELAPAEKHQLSHRARAAEHMRKILLELCR